MSTSSPPPTTYENEDHVRRIVDSLGHHAVKGHEHRAHERHYTGFSVWIIDKAGEAVTEQKCWATDISLGGIGLMANRHCEGRLTIKVSTEHEAPVFLTTTVRHCLEVIPGVFCVGLQFA